MRYTNDELQHALEQLNKEQFPMGAFLGALIGGTLAVGIFIVLSFMSAFFIWMIILPSLTVGLFSGFTGRIHEFKYRIIPGTIAALVHIGCMLTFFKIHLLFLFLTPISFFGATWLSKRKLNNIQHSAIWAKNHKLI
jgi:uncharacterized membrane protein